MAVLTAGAIGMENEGDATQVLFRGCCSGDTAFGWLPLGLGIEKGSGAVLFGYTAQGRQGWSCIAGSVLG